MNALNLIGAVKMADRVAHFIPVFGRFRSITVNGATALKIFEAFINCIQHSKGMKYALRAVYRRNAINQATSNCGGSASRRRNAYFTRLRTVSGNVYLKTVLKGGGYEI